MLNKNETLRRVGVITCPGCEAQCYKSLYERRAVGGTRQFVLCELRDDCNMVVIEEGSPKGRKVK